jgi:hypothetical protein
MTFYLAGCKKHEDVTGDFTSPIINNIKTTVSILSISPPLFKCVIQWDTDEISTSQVEYGLNVGYGSQTEENLNKIINHSITINSLSVNTTYHFRVKSYDDSGNLTVSDDNIFSTPEIYL